MIPELNEVQTIAHGHTLLHGVMRNCGMAALVLLKAIANR